VSAYENSRLPEFSLFLPTLEDKVAGRQGGGREIMRDNECNSETKKTGSEECQLG
jgi:hypothetical protein